MQLTKTGKYQNRLLLIVLGSVVICLLAWNGAFKKTITTYNDVQLLRNSKSQMDQSSLRKQQLVDEINQFNSVLAIGENKIQTESVFEELVTICESIGNVRILNFPDIHQIDINGYKVTTIFASFEGDFLDLLELVYTLERNMKTGRLGSINFKKSKDIKTGEEYLSLTILLQNYELVNPPKN
jgi:hypothetical protein